MGGPGRPAAPVLRPQGAGEVVDRQAAPVGVVHRHPRRELVIALGGHRLGNQRVPAVGADHDAGALGDRASSVRAPADAGHPPAIEQQLVDREALPQLGAGLDGGVDQELVEDRAPRRVRVRHPVDRPRGARELQRAEVERVGLDRRAAGRLQASQQAPALERRDPGGMHEVGRHRVAREARLVEQQHPVALPRQQHRRWRTPAARADDDRVVTGRAHAAPPAVRTRSGSSSAFGERRVERSQQLLGLLDRGVVGAPVDHAAAASRSGRSPPRGSPGGSPGPHGPRSGSSAR